MGLSDVNTLLAIPVIIHHPPEYLCLLRKEKKPSQIPNTPNLFSDEPHLPPSKHHINTSNPSPHLLQVPPRNAPDRWESRVANGWNRSPWHPQLLSHCHAKVSRSLHSVQKNSPRPEWYHFKYCLWKIHLISTNVLLLVDSINMAESYDDACPWLTNILFNSMIQYVICLCIYIYHCMIFPYCMSVSSQMKHDEADRSDDTLLQFKFWHPQKAGKTSMFQQWKPQLVLVSPPKKKNILQGTRKHGIPPNGNFEPNHQLKRCRRISQVSVRVSLPHPSQPSRIQLESIRA